MEKTLCFHRLLCKHSGNRQQISYVPIWISVAESFDRRSLNSEEKVMKNIGYFFLLILFSAGAASAQQRFVAALDGKQEVPANASAGKGTCTIVLNTAQTEITVNCTFSGLGTTAVAAHIHGNAAPGVNAGILFGFTGVPAATSGTIGPLVFSVTAPQVAN